jgi:hypothetical protein
MEVSSPPATEKTGATSREIESRQGIDRVVGCTKKLMVWTKKMFSVVITPFYPIM